MARFFFYKLTVDNGGAPCVYNDLLSLAICKPMIRSSADEKDVIFGFAGNAINGENPIIYIAVITKKEKEGNYFTEKYFSRPDCIYKKYKDGTFRYRSSTAQFHTPDDLEHDLGKPPIFNRANVLLSDDFRYFGNKPISIERREYPNIKKAINNLGVGHRVNHLPELIEELEILKERIWELPGRVHGEPHSKPSRKVCQRSKSFGLIAQDC